MIVVVEGPSAAGKTTWCRRHAPSAVAEYLSTGAEPGEADPPAQAAYWVTANSQRWAQARALEARNGVAVCDTDPMKLHYAWSLARVGAAPRTRFEHELVATRRAFAASALGLADLVLISVPPPSVLRQRRDGDPLRLRRTFGLHALLGEPLREWYRAVEALEPGRVVWELPDDGLAAPLPPPRVDRSDVELLDRLVALLPPL